MEIISLGTPNKKIVEEITEIHVRTFKGFFLTFMGRGFLKQMYSAYLAHNKSNILIATEDNKVVGFLAYSSDMSGLYKYMIASRLIPFAWYSLGAFFRKPKSFFHLIRAFLKPTETKREEKYVELASIGVNPESKAKGIGTALIDKLKENVDFSEFSYITLETDAVDNEAANKFYIKNGFKLIREYETHEGRKMNEYRWSL